MDVRYCHAVERSLAKFLCHVIACRLPYLAEATDAITREIGFLGADDLQCLRKMIIDMIAFIHSDDAQLFGFVEQNTALSDEDFEVEPIFSDLRSLSLRMVSGTTFIHWVAAVAAETVGVGIDTREDGGSFTLTIVPTYTESAINRLSTSLVSSFLYIVTSRVAGYHARLVEGTPHTAGGGVVIEIMRVREVYNA